MALLSSPANLPTSVSKLAEMIDEMWYQCGDTDTNVRPTLILVHLVASHSPYAPSSNPFFRINMNEFGFFGCELILSLVHMVH